MRSVGISFFWDLPSCELTPTFMRAHPPGSTQWSLTWLRVGVVVGTYHADCVRDRPMPNWLKDAVKRQ